MSARMMQPAPLPPGGFFPPQGLRPTGFAAPRAVPGGVVMNEGSFVRVPSTEALRGARRHATDPARGRSLEPATDRTEPGAGQRQPGGPAAEDGEKQALQKRCGELEGRVLSLEQSLHAALARIAALEIAAHRGAPPELLPQTDAFPPAPPLNVLAEPEEKELPVAREQVEESLEPESSIEVAPRSLVANRSEVHASPPSRPVSAAGTYSSRASNSAQRSGSAKRPRPNLGPFHKPKLTADRKLSPERKARSASPGASGRRPARRSGPSADTSQGKELHKGLQPGSPLQTPDLSFVAHITWHDQLVSSATFLLDLVPDEEFLYLTTTPLPPYTMDAATEDLSAAFSGVTVVVFAINTATAKTTMVFKSHSSHVKKPPVSQSANGGYFSHSCWLAGKGVNVVGGVRVFFDQVPSPSAPGKSALQIHRLSLKFWYPDSRLAQPFRESDLLQLLRLLGVLPE